MIVTSSGSNHVVQYTDDWHYLSLFSHTQLASKGSLGARINELKQRVIAENPHRYAVAVPRESQIIYQWTNIIVHHLVTFI